MFLFCNHQRIAASPKKGNRRQEALYFNKKSMLKSLLIMLITICKQITLFDYVTFFHARSRFFAPQKVHAPICSRGKKRPNPTGPFPHASALKQANTDRNFTPERCLFFPLPFRTKIWLTCVFFYATIPLAVEKDRHAGIAQSVEQLIRNQQVVCSSHIASSKRKPRVFGHGVFFFF